MALSRLVNNAIRSAPKPGFTRFFGPAITGHTAWMQHSFLWQWAQWTATGTVGGYRTVMSDAVRNAGVRP
jgi:hypothetical protein